jgi:hypothetical protein
MDTKRYQSIYVTLSNGKTGFFTGPCLVTEGDAAEGVQIVDVKFTQSKDLPPDISFESIENGK